MSKTNQESMENSYYQITYVKNPKNNKKYKNEGYYNPEEFPKNKFNSKFNRFNYINSRKCSKDSSNLSTSNEENTSSPVKYNKNCYKGNASDFKIKYKTELCKFFEINGNCKYGDHCAYAHGIENLRSKVTNSTAYRTRKCIQFFEYGYCPYGSRCQFKHQLQSNIINNPYDRKMTYKKILDTISKLENVDNIKKLIGKPRLSIFKEIVDDKNIVQTESRLLGDIKALKKENNFLSK